MRKIDIPKDVLYDLYVNQNISARDIAAKFGCNHSTILRRLYSHGIPTRDRNDPIYHPLHVNVDFFKEMSHDLAYVLGLLVTDGNIHGNMISLVSTNKEVIEWVVNKIGYSNAIYGPFNNRDYHIAFSNEEVRKILIDRYNITQKKSLTAMFPEAISTIYLPDYIRGVFDGDGSVYYERKQLTVSFGSASKNFMESIKYTIEEDIGGSRRISVDRNKKNPFYQYKLSKKEHVKKFAEYIYRNDAFGMERNKKERFRVAGFIE